MPRHIAYLSMRLTMAVLGFAKRRLIVSCPPRHGKSEQISNWLPTWFLNNRPHGRVMLGAYNTDFAKQWGRKVRNNIETYGHELNVRMSGDSTGVEHWHTSAGGGMMARGLGGAFTGFGGDLLICVVGDTEVETDIGRVRVKDLEGTAEQRKILAYDTDTRRICWQAITGFGSRPADGLYRITTRSGRVVKTSEEHPFWTGDGYTRADQLAPGDRLLLALPEDTNDAGVRLREVGASGRQDALLLEGVRVPAAERYEAETDGVQSLPRTGEARPAALLGELPYGVLRRDAGEHAGEAPCEAHDEALSVLPPDVHGHDDVLLTEVRGSDARLADEQHGQSRMARRCEHGSLSAAQPASVSTRANDGVLPRQSPVRGVQAEAQAARASHEYGRERQPDDQPGDVVQQVPRDVARGRTFNEQADSVALVEYLPGDAVVYSIRVAGTSNFFANDVLTHNCDDPIKSAAEANSAAYREAVSDWWRSAFMTRVEPGATVVLTMTRWHTDDLVGRILSDPEQAQQWDVITLPAIADEQGDLLGRKAGEALWPERKSAADLAQEKISVGDYVWKALYQQVPPNLNGGTVYYSFKHGINPLGSLDPTLDVVNDVPLDLSIDFNRQPGSHAVIGQFHKATGTAVALEELMTPAGVAKHIALAFVKWWQTKKPRVPYVNLYGDASGGAGVMTDGKTAWNTVETELRTAGIPFKTRVGAKNPGVHDRVEAVNTALFDAAGERHYLIHPRCHRLIRDFQKVIWDGDDLNKRGNVELTHISDADGYRIASILPVRRTRFHTISASTL